MTAAHDSRAEAIKEAAVLRSLADAVASPVVAGRKSRKGLTSKQRFEWDRVSCVVVQHGSRNPALANDHPDAVANEWQKECVKTGIGAGLFGWLIWKWAFPLLFELAKLWIESRNQGRVSDR